MAAATLECDICNEEFDSGNHKPLCLNCGHTFCFFCIMELMTSSDICICPKCRKETAQDINKILVNYALIPSENKPYQRLPRSPSETPCLQHRKALDYLCVDCIELACFTCTRDTHATHKIEAIDDLLSGDESVVNSMKKIQTKMQDKISGFKNLAMEYDDFSSWIDDVINVKKDLDEWKEALQVQIVSADEDFQVWKESVSNADEKKRLEYVEILRRLQIKPAVYSKLPEIRAKLEAVVNKCRSLKMPVNPQNLSPHGQPLTITNFDEGKRAVRNLLPNRKSSNLVVISFHTNPIPQLDELLELIVSNDTGDVCLVNMDYYWRAPILQDGSLNTVIAKFGCWLSALYGSPYNVMNYVRQRKRKPRMFGVRFDTFQGLDYCIKNELPACEDVCCVRLRAVPNSQICTCVPDSLGTTLKDRGWKISRWHFPHLRDDDLDWMCKILQPFKDCSFSLVIPSDHLTGLGSRRLVEMLPNAKYIYCDPRPKLPTSASLQASTSTGDLVPQGCFSRSKFTELSTEIILQWVNNATSK
ncbi:uncharacterized protein LOC108668250 [Hyalella azteca]|uniref:Uncharacterized protein LOC108668250 n=1 Tax=Hyalella azteca TaxID=294128 RepID=A0A8B7NBF8_HYAAZ|nr:uncharacterized protein LOC108668250 [Hyalella azteca]